MKYKKKCMKYKQWHFDPIYAHRIAKVLFMAGLRAYEGEVKSITSE